MVYQATNLISRRVYTVKLEPHSGGASTIEREYHILKQLEGQPGVVCAHWFGRELNFNAIVLDLLGPSLQDILAQRKTLSPSIVHHLGNQLVCNFHLLFC